MKEERHEKNSMTDLEAFTKYTALNFMHFHTTTDDPEIVLTTVDNNCITFVSKYVKYAIDTVFRHKISTNHGNLKRQ